MKYCKAAVVALCVANGVVAVPASASRQHEHAGELGAALDVVDIFRRALAEVEAGKEPGNGLAAAAKTAQTQLASRSAQLPADQDSSAALTTLTKPDRRSMAASPEAVEKREEADSAGLRKVYGRMDAADARIVPSRHYPRMVAADHAIEHTRAHSRRMEADGARERHEAMESDFDAKPSEAKQEKKLVKALRKLGVLDDEGKLSIKRLLQLGKSGGDGKKKKQIKTTRAEEKKLKKELQDIGLLRKNGKLNTKKFLESLKEGKVAE